MSQSLEAYRARRAYILMCKRKFETARSQVKYHELIKACLEDKKKYFEELEQIKSAIISYSGY